MPLPALPLNGWESVSSDNVTEMSIKIPHVTSGIISKGNAKDILNLIYFVITLQDFYTSTLLVAVVEGQHMECFMP